MKAIISGLIILTSAIVSFAQDEVLKIDTGLVTLNVSATDKDGNHVVGLKRNDFVVTDNGVVQAIEVFSNDDAPVSFGIVYDMHSAVDDKTGNILAALREFTSELKPRESYFVTVFGDKGSLTADFVPTREHLSRQLVTDASGGTKSLYDAIFAASIKLTASPNAKKVLIVLTDGEDKSSHHSLRELRSHLRAINLPLYSLTFGSGSTLEYGYSDILRDGPRQRLATGEASAIDRAGIAELSKDSGGGTAEADIRNRAYLAALGRQLLHDVRSQYVIGFVPETFDGKWHKLKISLSRPQKGLKVTGRNGYQSPVADPRK